MANALHTLIAAQKDVVNKLKKILDETKKVYKNAQLYLEGKTVVVETLVEDEPEHDGSVEQVVTTVLERFFYTCEHVSKAATLAADKAETNAHARADYVVTLKNGETVVIGENMLGLAILEVQKHAAMLLDSFKDGPTLDNRIVWKEDTNNPGQYVSPTTSKLGTRRVTSFVVAHEGYPKEGLPADIREVSKDINVRVTKTTKRSGGIPSTVKAAIIDLLERIIEGGTVAVQKANKQEAKSTDYFENIMKLIKSETDKALKELK